MLFTIFDTETTGFSAKHRILEIGLVQIDETGQVVNEFETLINPERDFENSHIHGITPRMIHRAPAFREVARSIVELFEQSDLLMAFNLPFDWRMLGYEFERLGYQPPSGVGRFCLMEFLHERAPQGVRKLQDLCTHFGVELGLAHSALSDARATAGLLKLFLHELDTGGASRIAWERDGLADPSPPFPRAQAEDGEKLAVPILDRLTRALGAPGGMADYEPYFDLLDRVFADSVLEESEIAELLALAQDLGMSADDAQRAHQTYIDGIYELALQDGFLSEMECRHLEAISEALDVSPQVEPARRAELALYPRDLEGKFVCFTGTPEGLLDGRALDRVEMAELAADAGLVVKSGVSKKLDFLVARDPFSQSGKANKARDYDIPIVAEQVFWNWLGVQVTTEHSGEVALVEETNDVERPTAPVCSLELELLYNPRLNYAAFQNSVPAISLLSLENRGDSTYHDLSLEVTVEPEIALEPWKQRLESLAPGQRFEPRTVDLLLSSEKLLDFDEREVGYLHARVYAGNEEVLKKSFPLEILAFNEWGGGQVAPQLLAAFSQPNHSRLSELAGPAAKWLESWSGDPSFNGYQSRSRKRVREMAAAFFFAIRERGLQYINPPASFENTGQKIRTVDQILDQGRGTCLDFTLLLCACLEHAGLNPLVVVLNGHALPGVWLEDSTYDHTVTDEPLEVLKRIEVGQICLFDSSSVVHETVEFERAESKAAEYVEREFLYLVDVKQARQERILPLSSRHSKTEPAHAPLMESPKNLQPVELKNLSVLDQQTAVEDGTLTPAEQRINRWKEKLLDLTLRNRLLNFKPQKKTLSLQHQNLAGLEDLLAAGKKFRLFPKLELNNERDQTLHQERTGEDLLTERLGSQLASGRLHTLHGKDELERKLVSISREARTVQEETGSNTLFMALGFLEWYESESSEDPRRAPILLVPCNIDRKGAGKPFGLTTAEEDTQINITLLEKLRREFGIEIPGLETLPEDESGLHVERIFLHFKRHVLDVPRWRVVEEACLGFFSFTKFLMWQDLQNRSEVLTESPVVARLLGTVEQQEDGEQFLPSSDLDARRPADSCLCPLDADSSQLSAVYAAEEGKSFVLQGPPGTGKSQTITNMIAQSLASGKRVLFVAEKRAALEVVFKRLEAVGLGAFCLELHSKKARKTDILEQLRASLELAREREPQGWSELATGLQLARDELNRYAGELHKPAPLGLSFYEAISEEIALSGTPTFSFELKGSDSLDRDRFNALEQAARQLEFACKEISGPTREHPLHGIGIDDHSPKTEEKLGQTLEQVREQVAKVGNAVEQLSDRLALKPRGWSFSQLDRLASFCRDFWEYPGVSAAVLQTPNWAEQKQRVQEWLRLVRRAQVLRNLLEERFKSEKLLELNLETLVEQHENHESSNALVSFFGLWSARRALKPSLKEKLPKGFDVLEILRSGVELKTHLEKLQELHSEAGETLGTVWQGEQTESKKAEELLSWAEDFRKEMFWLEEETSDLELRTRVAKLLPTARERWSEPFLLVKEQRALSESYGHLEREASLTPKFQAELLEEGDFLKALNQRVSGWGSALRELRTWTGYVRAKNRAVELGLRGLVEQLETGEAPASKSVRACRASVLGSWVREVLEENETLRQFRGSAHSQLIEKFREDDQKSLELAQRVIRARLAARVPVMGDSTSPSSELGILKRELKKQRAHLSCRRLFEKLPNLLPVLKPCVLMSPLSVSQYLDPKNEKFDLVVFDEASQITVWDSIGSLMRAKQAVIVGDSRQLPPTSFFKIQDSDENAGFDGVEDLESILDECQASGLPEHSLRWHYRSRHEDLITFSNRRYYDSKLLTFPSAFTDHPRLGVQFFPIEGTYDRGGSRTNRAEAEAIVKTIVKRLHHPEKRTQSIGVVTFNTQQQFLIEDLLDEVRMKDPVIDPYFTGAVEEPVFVKNLENVQGDERDVILFSITYGPDQTGKISMNFGPINKSGGERRLNVAVTRARERLEVYSSLSPTDIDLNRTNQLGSKHLRAFLSYAERGMAALLNTAETDWQPDYESILEEEIGEALESLGWDIHQQVGCLGYRVDLGVVHPEIPGVYLAGIECDGATYHSSKCARDRDRIRQAVLESLGWNVLRVWSTDWWHDSKRELEKLDAGLRQTLERFETIDAIPFAITNEPREEGEEDTFDSAELDRIFDQPEASGEGLPSWEGMPLPGTAEYVMADLQAFNGTSDDFYDKLKTDRVKQAVEECLKVEAPISLTEAARRVGERYDLSRITKRVRKRFFQVVEALPEARVRGDFVWYGPAEPSAYSEVRRPDDNYRREAEDICDEEIANGAVLILKQNIALPSEDLVRETARLFGFKQLGSKVKLRMEAGVEKLIASGRGSIEGDTVRCLAEAR